MDGKLTSMILSDEDRVIADAVIRARPNVANRSELFRTLTREALEAEARAGLSLLSEGEGAEVLGVYVLRQAPGYQGGHYIVGRTVCQTAADAARAVMRELALNEEAG